MLLIISLMLCRLQDYFFIRYYAIVTVTTVGYGDITPKSRAGRFAATYYIVSLLFWLPTKVNCMKTS